jgi:transcriptional regulator with XRE-family HTH domain
MTTKYAKRFASTLSSLMEGYGITFEELSKRTGLSHGTLHRYTKGQAEPSLSNALTLAKFFGRTVEDMVQ